jgi:hypothetical protein
MLKLSGREAPRVTQGELLSRRFYFGPVQRKMASERGQGGSIMCRNIKPLFNFDPPATDDEIEAAALQFVRKISGFTHPSKVNEPAFERAVAEIAGTARKLVDELETNAPPKNRAQEAAKAKARSALRFA